jgi:FlaA1/EpsC-like NDP-sugar epimerase
LPDIGVAAFAPLLALYLRDTQIFTPGYSELIPIYWGLSFAFALIAFAMFRIHGAIPRYFSVGDLARLGTAVLAAEMSTCVVLFSLTRLEGVPRSIPAIHALILGAGLVAVRALTWLVDRSRPQAATPAADTLEHIIVIGISDLSVLFTKFLGTAFGGTRRVIALLDENPRWFGRAVDGVRVYGPPSHLDALVGEFATHGLRTDRVLIGHARNELSAAALSQIECVCTDHGIHL